MFARPEIHLVLETLRCDDDRRQFAERRSTTPARVPRAEADRMALAFCL